MDKPAYLNIHELEDYLGVGHDECETRRTDLWRCRGRSTGRSRLIRGWRKSDVEESKAHEA